MPDPQELILEGSVDLMNDAASVGKKKGVSDARLGADIPGDCRYCRRLRIRGISAASAGLGQVIFVVFLILFAVSLIAGLIGRA